MSAAASALRRNLVGVVSKQQEQHGKRMMSKRYVSTSSSTSTSTQSGSAVPPPPPPAGSGSGAGAGAAKPSSSSSNSSGGSGPGFGTFLVIGAGAAGAYYFKDDIMKQLGMNNKASTPAPAAKTSAAPTPIVAAAPAAAATEVKKEVKKEASSPAISEVKKEVQEAQRRIEGAEAIAKGKTPVVDYKLVREAIVNILEDPSYDDGSFGPLFVRLAWHASGTYDKVSNTGGSDGATMRFSPESDWGANGGLHIARAKLEPIKKAFPGLSYADLWTYAGTVAIEEMGGPKMNWRAGRKDQDLATLKALPDGRLPDADGRDKKEHPADHLRDIFYKMGFDDREIVVLSGAHALGRCHTDRSGYWGPWTRAPTTFSNEYYKLLLEEKWTPKKTHEGKPWTGPFQYEDKTGELMMLPTDLALIQDPKMRPYVEKYAKDEAAFMKDFAAAWIKLNELGVKAFHGRRRYYFFGPRE